MKRFATALCVAMLSMSTAPVSFAADPPQVSISEKDLPADIQKELAALKKAVGNGEMSSKAYQARRKAILEQAAKQAK